MDNRFNLIDEPWIPVAAKGRVSLKDIFKDRQLSALSANPVQKIALMKLLQAIAQSAATPLDDGDWRTLGWQGMAERCLNYLDKWHAHFYLYGEKPFLQMPAMSAAEVKSLAVLSPEISTGNTTVLMETQQQQCMDDADKALLLLVQMGFGLGGKKTDNSVVLTPGYRGKKNDKGKAASGKAGSAVGHMGLLHSHWLGESIVHSIWLNLFTAEDIAELTMYPELGIAPWQQMPSGEDDAIAQALKRSLLGRLLPLGKFCLLTDKGIHYSDGIAHEGYLEGKADPTVSVDFSQKKPKALWVNPGKRPWRELTSLLQFIDQTQVSGFDTLQLKRTLKRVSRNNAFITLWSGGLRVSSNAGEQYASGNDDYVESSLGLPTDLLGTVNLELVKREMAQLETVQKGLWSAVVHYFHYLSDGNSPASGKAPPLAANQADKATTLFWQLCERHSQALFRACAMSVKGRPTRRQLRRCFADYAQQLFDQRCPASSARQVDAWAQSRPNFAKYIDAE